MAEGLSELIQTYGTESWSAAVNLNVDVEVSLYVLVQALLAAVTRRLPELAMNGQAALRHQLFELPGQLTMSDHTITVHIDRSPWSPILRKAALPGRTIVPWWGGRVLRIEVV